MAMLPMHVEQEQLEWKVQKMEGVEEERMERRKQGVGLISLPPF